MNACVPFEHIQSIGDRNPAYCTRTMWSMWARSKLGFKTQPGVYKIYSDETGRNSVNHKNFTESVETNN